MNHSLRTWQKLEHKSTMVMNSTEISVSTRLFVYLDHRSFKCLATVPVPVLLVYVIISL